jgi:mono/diheme cytochrome c family protein
VGRIQISKAAALGMTAAWLVSIAVGVSAQVKNPEAAKLVNPAKATPESLEAGKTAYLKYCKFCHGADADGKPTIVPKGTAPANLIDAKWEHGSTDGEIFMTVKEGIAPKFEMKAMKTKMTDPEIWNVVNYLRSIGPKTR